MSPELKYRRSSGHVIEPQPRRTEKPETYPPGRKCKRCSYPLSIYNPSSECHHHKLDGEPRYRFVDSFTELEELMSS